MKFSLLSWNVEHFRGGDERVKIVAKHIQKHDPDVFGLFEVENLDVLELIRNYFPDYNFNITDGPETQEILVGYRKGKFSQVIFTQKREFDAFNPSLRPGALLSLVIADEFYNILFLHTDSGTSAPDFGNRAEMFEKIWNMKKAIDKKSAASNSVGRLIVLGDLNTMGLQYPGTRVADRLLTEEAEIQSIGNFAAKFDMSLPTKEFDKTYTNGRLKSNLDHVLISASINLKQLGVKDNADPFQVAVSGWQQLQGQERKTFIDSISDHCALYLEIT